MEYFFVGGGLLFCCRQRSIIHGCLLDSLLDCICFQTLEKKEESGVETEEVGGENQEDEEEEKDDDVEDFEGEEYDEDDLEEVIC